MSKIRVLVAFATKSGSTAGIAEAIGQSISDAGLTAHVRPASEATDAGKYGALVIGSPIFGGQWLPEAIALVEAHELEFMDRPVFFFSAGMLPVMNPRGAKAEHEGAAEHVRLRAPGVKPRLHGIFAGAWDPATADFVSRKLMREKNAPAGDFRDWKKVAAWGRSVSRALDQAERKAA